MSPIAHHLTSTFFSEGVRCAATLHLPDRVDKPPAVLMVHGWGATQATLTRQFCERFAQAGLASMTFDYRGWGHSEGAPRQVIRARDRLQDASAALRHLKEQPLIDAARIVLWGSSFGGGHVVDLAARHPEVRAAIAQVPMLDGLAAATASPWLRTLQFSAYALADLVFGRARPLYLPVVAPLGQWGTMDRDDAYQALMHGVEEGQTYDNRIAARSLLTMAPYRPFKRLKDIKVPTLIIGATRDSVAPFVEQRVRQARNPYLQMATLEGHHFDPYAGPVLERNMALQMDFLRGLNLLTPPASTSSPLEASA